MPVLELVDEIVEVVGLKEKKTSSSRRRETSFDPPVDFNVITNVPPAPFLGKLTVAQGGSHKEKVGSAQSSDVESLTAEGKNVWIKVPEKEKKKEND